MFYFKEKSVKIVLKVVNCQKQQGNDKLGCTVGKLPLSINLYINPCHAE